MRKVYRYIAFCLITFLFVWQQVENNIVYCENWKKTEIQKDADDTEYKQLQVMAQLHILSALEKYNGNQPVVVAVLDTGIDYQHEDLAQNIWKNEMEIPENGIDDDKNGYVDDVYGWDFFNNDNTISCLDEGNAENNLSGDNHGTHCAGLIAAKAGNGIGTAGIAG